MSVSIHLDEFILTRLHVDWHGSPEAAAGGTEKEIRVGYNVATKKDDATRFKFDLRVALVPKSAKKKTGWEIDTAITGFFSFPEGIDAATMDEAVRFNGILILFGILRGLLASATGAFPGGKYCLPALPVQDIVNAGRKKPAGGGAREPKPVARAVPAKSARVRKSRKPPAK